MTEFIGDNKDVLKIFGQISEEAKSGEI